MSDALLAARLCAGDDSAMAEVFSCYGSLVLHVAKRVTCDRAMAEDVLQEVFAALWAHPERFDATRGTLRAYLGVMAQRRAVDSVRSAGRRQARDAQAESLSAFSPTDQAEAAVLSQVIRAAIDRLPVEQRHAVELAFWEGLTCHEVAQRLRLPVGTVKSRLRLAHAKLRESLAPLKVEEAV